MLEDSTRRPHSVALGDSSNNSHNRVLVSVVLQRQLLLASVRSPHQVLSVNHSSSRRDNKVPLV